MKIGIMQSSFVASTDADRFAQCRAAGADGVEIELTPADLGPAWEVRRAELIAAAKSHGVEISSTCLGFHNSGGLATWWRGPEADDEVRRAVAATASVGAKVMLLPFFFFNEPKGLAHRRAVAQRLRPLCALAADLGVTIAYEGVLPAAQFKELAAMVASPAFGIYYDVANATWCDLDPYRELRDLGSLVRQVHVKDALTFTGDVRPGIGRVNFPAWRESLAAISYDGWAVLETPTAGADVLAGDVKFVRDLLAR